MTQCGTRSRLAVEATECRLVAKRASRQDLQSHLAYELQVVRLVHRAHTATTNQPVETIFAIDDSLHGDGERQIVSIDSECHDHCLRATPLMMTPGVVEMKRASLPSSISTKANLSAPNSGDLQVAVPMPFGLTE